jgi:hypothetical protein
MKLKHKFYHFQNDILAKFESEIKSEIKKYILLLLLEAEKLLYDLKW